MDTLALPLHRHCGSVESVLLKHKNKTWVSASWLFKRRWRQERYKSAHMNYTNNRTFLKIAHHKWTEEAFLLTFIHWSEMCLTSYSEPNEQGNENINLFTQGSSFICTVNTVWAQCSGLCVILMRCESLEKDEVFFDGLSSTVCEKWTLRWFSCLLYAGEESLKVKYEKNYL